MATTASRAAYALGSKDEEARVVEALGRTFPAVVDRPAAATGVYLDTFEGGLWRAGLALIASGASGRDEWVLQTAEGETLGAIPPVPSALTGGDPQRHGLAPRQRDFPPGPFRDRVAPALGLRRLTPLARFRLRRREIRILDRRGKTVARLTVERATAGEPGDERLHRRVRPVLVLEPVRGYERAASKVDRYLRETCGLDVAEPLRFRRILAAVGRDLPGEGAAPHDPLERGLRADEALRRILRAQLDVVEANADGTRDGLDTEFLHDFRVAVRRTRSALSQLKGVLPAAELRRFRKGFKWLGGETGPLRDLDVYLLKMPAYRKSLDAEAAGALDPLEALLHRRRSEAQAALTRALRSKRYRKLTREWRAWLDATPGTETADGARPVERVAEERIGHAAARVLGRGGAIDDDSPGDDLHALRIDCKKLRYLLEFFAPLFDAAAVRKTVKALKRLQDVLGDFNDLEVQRDKLGGFARELEAAHDGDAGTLIAVGRLVEKLAERQAAERALFRERFDRFASAANRKRMARLFPIPDEGPTADGGASADGATTPDDGAATEGGAS